MQTFSICFHRRAVTTAVCCLVGTANCTPEEAFDIIKSKRDVSARIVLKTKVIKDFYQNVRNRK